MLLRNHLFFVLILFLAACNEAAENTKPVPAKSALKAPAEKHKRKYLILPQSKPEAGQYCFINKAYTATGIQYIEADYVDFLMGDKAIEAAKAKGDSEMVLDDYYIRNDNKKIRKLTLAGDVSILTVEAQDEKLYHVEAGFNDLQKYISNTLFILQIENGLVKQIKIQYLP